MTDFISLSYSRTIGIKARHCNGGVPSTTSPSGELNYDPYSRFFVLKTMTTSNGQFLGWSPGNYNVVLPFTHAPSLFPPCSPHVPSRTVNPVTAGKTSRRQWLRKSKKTRKSNVVGKNNAPNPLKSKLTQKQKQNLKKLWGRHMRQTQVTSRV